MGDTMAQATDIRGHSCVPQTYMAQGWGPLLLELVKGAFKIVGLMELLLVLVECFFRGKQA